MWKFWCSECWCDKSVVAFRGENVTQPSLGCIEGGFKDVPIVEFDEKETFRRVIVN